MAKGVKRPNLIYVFADQLRYQSLGYGGDDRALTPNIDRLASEGVSFCNCVSGHPMCAPYRASLFSGKYPSSTGMVINELRMNPDHRCIGHVLGDAGYETAYIGKWHLWANASDHSKDENHFVPPGPDRLGWDGYWAAYNFWHSYYHAFYFEDTMERIAVDGYEPDVQTDMALAWLNAHRDDEVPLCLFLSYGTPHDPWEEDNVPAEWLARFDEADFPLCETYADGSAEYWNPRMDRQWWLENVKPNLSRWQRIYYAMTANLDWNIGRLLQGLDAAGLGDDTVLVFSSDHGEMFGAHGRIAKNIFYDEATRIPMLMRWPGRIPAASVSEACMNVPDIMPTLLGLLDLPIPAAVEGLDLSHCALAQPGLDPEAAFMQGMGHTYLWVDGNEWRAARDKRFTYAIMRADGSEYLFDNVADPLQQHNLLHDLCYERDLERLRAFVAERMRALGDAFQPTTWYRGRWVEDRKIVRSATLHVDG